MFGDVLCSSICGIRKLEALWVPMAMKGSGRKQGMCIMYYVVETIDYIYVGRSE